MNIYCTAIVILALPAIAIAQIDGKSETVQTTFGRYGSQCSSGRGACSFSVTKAETNFLSAKTSRKVNSNTIALDIKRNAITADEEIRIAGKPFSEIKPGEIIYFVQSESLLLDAATIKFLNVNPRLNKILLGNYPMTITSTKIEVLFTLSTSN